MIVAAGGSVTGSVSKKTDFRGRRRGRGEQACPGRAAGDPILDEAGLRRLLESGS